MGDEDMSIGIIGGSGLYEWGALKDGQWMDVRTPWGNPSDQILKGTLDGKEVFFIPRHGRGHRLLPSEINYRANIHALKQLQVDGIISVTAVGSLHENIRPRDVLIPDQYFDRTRSSPQHTFFGSGIAGHVSLGDPVCPFLHKLLGDIATQVRDSSDAFSDRKVHRAGTYVNMEGPAFSTRAESEFYRRQGFEIIGMTSLPEARLAREAELPYAALALITDYDCWHREEGHVTAEMVSGHVRANTAFAQAILQGVVGQLPDGFPSAARTALIGAVMTDPSAIPPDTLKKVAWVEARMG